MFQSNHTHEMPISTGSVDDKEKIICLEAEVEKLRN